MKFEMFSEVKLQTDVPEHGLCRGDLATIVEFHPGALGQEPGYSLEVFNAVGDTVAVIALGESQIGMLREDEILCARVLASWIFRRSQSGMFVRGDATKLKRLL